MKNYVDLSQKFASIGIEKDVSDVILVMLATHLDESYATKVDIEQVRGEFKGEIGAVRGDIKAHFLLTKILAVIVLGLYGAGGALFISMLVK